MKNSPNIYELLNNLTLNLEDYTKEELDELEKQKLKKVFRKNIRKNIKKSISLKKVSALAVALLLIVGIFTQTGLGKVVYAATESKLAEISYTIAEALGIERNIEPYANVVNQVVENNGVEMKLTDVIIDKDELILSVVTSTPQPVQQVNFDYDIFINGKKIRNYSASGSSGPIDDSQTRFSSVYTVDIDNIERAKDINFKIVLKNLTYYHSDGTYEEVKGKWKFEFMASGKELTAHTYTLPLNYEFYIGNTKYTLEEFRYNPVNQKIFGKVQGQMPSSYEIDLRGWDDLGNEVRFTLTRLLGEELIFKYQNLYGDFSDEITSLTLTPYAAKLPEKSGKTSDSWEKVGEAFTIYLAQ